MSSVSEYSPKLTISEGARAYAKLRKEVTGAGLLERSYSFYFLNTYLTSLGFTLSLYVLLVSVNLWQNTIGALGVSFFAVQFGGLMHDAVHRAIFKSATANDIYGHIITSFVGVVYNSWKEKHNMHHSNPNMEDEDPDIEIPFLSLNNDRYETKKGLQKYLTKYQMYLYYPLGTLVGFSIRIGGLSYFKENFNFRSVWKMAVIAGGLFFWMGLPFFIFETTKAIYTVWLLNAGTGIYLANIFAPNHKGMPQLKKGQKLSFFEQQIITARNVKGGFLTDIFLLSLNYQIEHHLFPDCPRNKLKHLTPYVRRAAKEMGLQYTQTGLIKSNKIILQELNSVAVTV